MCGVLVVLAATGYLPPAFGVALRVGWAALAGLHSVAHWLAFVVFVLLAFEGMVIAQNRYEANGGDGSESEQGERVDNADEGAAEEFKLLAMPQYPDVDPATQLTSEWNVPEKVATELGYLVRLIDRDFVMTWYSGKDSPHTPPL